MSGGPTHANDQQSRLWAEVHALKDELAAAKDEIASLRKERAIQPDPESPAVSQFQSRRTLLKKAGLGAAVSAVGVLATSKNAAAADGDPILLGDETNGASTPTVVTATGALTRNAFTFEDAPGVYGASSSHASTLAAYAASGGPNAFFAYAENNADTSIATGHAIVAWAAPGSRSNILFRSNLANPTSSALAHSEGELVFDTNEDLWLCVETGTPGTWRKLAGPATAGSLHAVAPKRVWDTRFQGGPMTNNESRTVSVADGRVLSSSTVDTPNLVPEGAIAVAFNLTVVGTSAAGFLAVTPGDALAFTAASVNWSAANSVLNNGTMSTVDDSRQVTVWCSGSTDFVIDITGYYL